MLKFKFFKKAQARYGLAIFLFIILVFIDQALKSSFQNIFKNYNFIFSLPLNVYIMYAIYSAVLSAIIFYICRNWNRLEFIELFAWVLIFAGAVSNFGERLVLGYVRDFIYISNGVLNSADFYIILGVMILLFGQLHITDTKEIK